MLRERVEELQLTLQREIEQHQRELTALQTLDTERTQALTKSHKRQISQLQEQLQEMERKQGGSAGVVNAASSNLSPRGQDQIDTASKPSTPPDLTLQNELRDAKEKCHLLEEEISDLELKLQQMQTNREEKEQSQLQAFQSELEAAKSSLEGENTRLSEMVVMVRQETESVERRLRETEVQVAQLKEETCEKDDIIGSHEQKLRLLQSQLKESQEINNNLSEQVQQVSSEKSTLQESSARLQSQLEKEQLKATRFHGELDALRIQLTHKIESQIVHLEEEKRNLAEQLTKIETSVFTHEQGISRLRTAHDLSQREAEQLALRVDGLAKEVKEKEEEINRLRERELHGSETTTELQVSQGVSTAAQTQVEQENVALRETQDELRAQVVELKELLRRREASVDEGEQMGGIVAGRADQTVRDELARLREENEQLTGELEKLKARADEGTKAVKVESLGEGGEDLEERVMELDEKLQAEAARRERLQAHLALVAEEHDKELGLLLTEKDGLEREVGTLRDELSSSQLVQDETLSRISQVELENSELSEELCRRKETVAELEGDVERLQRSLLAVQEQSFEDTSGVLGRDKVAEKSANTDIEISDEVHLASSLGSTALLETIKDLETKLGEKERIILQLSVASEAAESSKSELGNSLRQLESQNVSLDQQLCDARANHQQLELELESLQESLKASEQRVPQLQRMVEEKEGKIAQLEREIIEISSERESTRREVASEIEGLQLELEQKAEVVKQQELNLRELGVLLKDRDREVAELSRGIEEGKEREEALITRCSELEEVHSEEKSVLLLKVQQLKQQELLLEKAQLDGSRSFESDRDELIAVQTKLKDTEGTLEERCTELARVASERDELTETLQRTQSELSRLSASLDQTRQKHHELLSSLRNEKDALSQELSATRQELDSLRMEKTKLEVKVQSLASSCSALQDEMESRLGEKQSECSKYSKELERLRRHLLQVEEQYTQEALRADEREAALRQQASRLDDRVRAAGMMETAQSQQAQQQLQSLQQQLQAMEAEREHTLQQLVAAQDLAEQRDTDLHNLQLVLEQFQRDQSSELSLALRQSQVELGDTRQECERLREEQRMLQSQLEDASAIAESVAELTHRLEEREQRITILTSEVDKLRGSLDESQLKVVQLAKEEHNRVDKNLVKNLVIGYIHAGNPKKPEVLQLIAKILEFSQDELDQVQGRGAWFSGLWKRPPSSPTILATQVEQATSLSQLFVKFLETESSPKTSSEPGRAGVPHRHGPDGYVDPRTDPDRPSLATAPLLGHPPSLPPPPPMTSSPTHSYPATTLSLTSVPPTITPSPPLNPRELLPKESSTGTPDQLPRLASMTLSPIPMFQQTPMSHSGTSIGDHSSATPDPETGSRLLQESPSTSSTRGYLTKEHPSHSFNTNHLVTQKGPVVSESPLPHTMPAGLALLADTSTLNRSREVETPSSGIFAFSPAVSVGRRGLESGSRSQSSSSIQSSLLRKILSE